MEAVGVNFLFNNWQRKVIALICAIVIWVYVSQTITATKTLPNVPVRVINLPVDKTIEGISSNGILSRRLTLTLSGTKNVIEAVEPSDLEVVIDAKNQPDEWVIQVNKKNLFSLNPEIDLKRHVNSLAHNDFVIKMSRLITEQVPVRFTALTGEPPEGYQFLDIGPQQLVQNVTGIEEEVLQLKDKGIQLSFDFSKVSKDELDSLRGFNQSIRNDEINFLVPDDWKKFSLPIEGEPIVALNDPQAKNLTITFLRKELIPVGAEVPIRVFYSPEFISQINPKKYPLALSEIIEKKDGLTLLKTPLYVKEVSRLFLDIVRHNMEIVILAAPESEREELQWSVELVNQLELENTFVAFLINTRYSDEQIDYKKREARLRRRFREFASKMNFFLHNGQPLYLQCSLENDAIKVKQLPLYIIP